MQLDASSLYNVALEQCMILQKQVIELKALYIESQTKLNELKEQMELLDNK